MKDFLIHIRCLANRHDDDVRCDIMKFMKRRLSFVVFLQNSKSRKETYNQHRHSSQTSRFGDLRLRLSCSFWTTSTGTTGSVRTIFYVCQDVTKSMSGISCSSIPVRCCATCCSQVCCLHHLITHFRFSAYILTDSFVNCSIRSTHEFDRLLQKHATETGLPVVVDFYR